MKFCMDVYDSEKDSVLSVEIEAESDGKATTQAIRAIRAHGIHAGRAVIRRSSTTVAAIFIDCGKYNVEFC